MTIDGKPAYGFLTEEGFVDLVPHLGSKYADLRELLAAQALAEAHELLSGARATPLANVVFDRLIPNLDARMFGLGWSYRDHQIETGKDAPSHPFLFNKLPQSMVGAGRDLLRPRHSTRFDFEGEIVIVIGKPGRHIPPARAMEHVAGYSIMMDGSVRDWQQHSVTAGKNFDASSAFGPCLVTTDEITDPSRMELVTRINGVEMQRSAFGLMAWPIDELIAYVSTFCRLEAGDSISTGTPGGVGHKRTPPVFLKSGDEVSVAVSGIGELRNRVVDER
ncbi:fumarylacetoacetate hydrolase family protein [Pandoraea pulmonicola]|uniref:fumarylacetoacetate hydrolase family protein n=1 Tax=Pandoraea pulmonicola TaxID=93221 RepID=UPI000AF8FFF2|nr:fumarylacetoacetate hydrolase family protein [Pandoraea pulmonicola]